MKRVGLIIGLIVALSIAQVSIQKRLEAYPRVEKESLLYLPSGKYLHALSLGYQQMAADLLWIKTVSYFGSHYMTDQQYPWLFHMLSLIIDLDPRFDFPYYFGGVVLSLEASQAENANKILERGIAAFPNQWLYPFYIGFNHYYHLGDPAKAAPFIERASKLPGAPPFTKTLAGTLYEKSGDLQSGLEFYRKVYNNTSDEMVRSKIAERIEALLSKQGKR